MSVGRDGRQGWSRKGEEAWERIFRPGPRSRCCGAEIAHESHSCIAYCVECGRDLGAPPLRERPEADAVARASCQGDE